MVPALRVWSAAITTEIHSTTGQKIFAGTADLRTNSIELDTERITKLRKLTAPRGMSSTR